VRAHFTFTDPKRLHDYVTVFQDPGAETYVTPVSATELEVALLLEREQMPSFAGRLEQAYDAYLRSRPHLRAVITDGRRSSAVLACGPFDARARCRVADRTMLVGDAGGYLDPITGEGISLALQSACWAAEIVDNALRRDDLTSTSLWPYQSRLERALRDYRILTRAMLCLLRHQVVSAFVVRRLACCPTLYTSLLAVNCGVRSFRELPLTEVLRFLFARHPQRTDSPVVARSPARRPDDGADCPRGNDEIAAV
jgi:2-polyprenyl-6-methoxyphenol hydroxylase-like FAD-dependent oxidoreductase